MNHIVETELEHVAEQNVDVPMPQSLEKTVEFEEIVDMPVLQFELIFLVDSRFFFCCGMERCTLFLFQIQFQ